MKTIAETIINAEQKTNGIAVTTIPAPSAEEDQDMEDMDIDIAEIEASAIVAQVNQVLGEIRRQRTSKQIWTLAKMLLR